MWQEILSFIFQFLKNITSFASWLTTPLDPFDIPPLAFFGLGGFVVIITLWIVKLGNPLS